MATFAAAAVDDAICSTELDQITRIIERKAEKIRESGKIAIASFIDNFAEQFRKTVYLLKIEPMQSDSTHSGNTKRGKMFFPLDAATIEWDALIALKEIFTEIQSSGLVDYVHNIISHAPFDMDLDREFPKTAEDWEYKLKSKKPKPQYDYEIEDRFRGLLLGKDYGNGIVFRSIPMSLIHLPMLKSYSIEQYFSKYQGEELERLQKHPFLFWSSISCYNTPGRREYYFACSFNF